MKKLLLLSVPLFIEYGCISDAATPKLNPPIQAIVNSNESLIQSIDSIVYAININNALYREVDTALVNNEQHKGYVKYLKDLDAKGGKLVRFTGIGITKADAVIFTYYYENEKLIKLEAEFKAAPPQTVVAYFNNGELIQASEGITLNSLMPALKTSDLMLAKVEKERSN